MSFNVSVYLCMGQEVVVEIAVQDVFPSRNLLPLEGTVMHITHYTARASITVTCHLANTTGHSQDNKSLMLFYSFLLFGGVLDSNFLYLISRHFVIDWVKPWGTMLRRRRPMSIES